MTLTPLKLAVLAAGLPQYQIARRAKVVNETRLSRLANGRALPTPEERKALARVLERCEEELFPAVAA